MDLMTVVVLLIVIGGVLLGSQDWVMPIFTAIIMGILGLMLGVLLYMLVGAVIDHTFTYEEANLKNIEDGSAIQGNFFLGTGYVDGVQKYSFYEDHGDWSELNSINAEGVKIYENSETPYIVRQKECISSKEWLVSCITDHRITEIHVPPDTIKTNFVLDAK
jgi:hypothetical protein